MAIDFFGLFTVGGKGNSARAPVEEIHRISFEELASALHLEGTVTFIRFDQKNGTRQIVVTVQKT